MSSVATPADAQAKIDAATAALLLTGASGKHMAATYGTDPTKWPAGPWHTAMAQLAAARAEIGQLIAPTPPTPPPPPPPAPVLTDYFARAAALTPPTMTVKRTLPKATTYAEVLAGIGALIPGDVLPCVGVLFPGEAVFTKKLAAYAKVTFDAACKFPGGAGLRLPAIWMKNVAYIQFIFDPATTITNPADGNGILLSGADHCVFDSFKVSHTAEDGLSGFPTVGHVQDCFFRGEVYDFCKVPSLDPHAEKGTGFHGFNTSDAAVGGYLFRNNLAALYVHNDDTAYGGSAVEHGNNMAAYAPSGNEFILKAHGLRQNATSQVAGNIVNLWGYIHDAKFTYLEGDDLSGKGVSAAARSSTVFSGVRVEKGVVSNVLLNPALKGQSPWDAAGGVSYGSVTP